MSVRSCAVHSCSNTTFKNPNLVFFALPRDAFMREEWMEVLSLRHKDISDQVRVCELHFKAKDFCSGKKQLKHHAVPAIRLGRGKNFIEVDSDDEFMQCNSDSDPEIIEIKKLSEEFLSSKEKKKEIAVVKTEVMSETESTSTETEGTGRRPSRRAARVAAEKISSVVRKFGISDEPPTKKEPPPKFRDQKEWHAIKAPIPDIDLMMECHEELLSAVQAECLLKAQLEYNMVMKKLRMLKASKARIVCSLSDESDNADHNASNCMLNEESDVTASTEVVLTPTAPQLIKEEPPVSSPEINCDNASVVPVKLSAAFEQPLVSNQIAQLSLLEATGKKSPEPAISEVLTTTSTPAVSKKTFLLIKKSSDPSQQVSYKLMLNSIPGVPSEKSVRVIPVSTISTRSQGIGLQCQKTYGKKPKVPDLSVDNTSVSSDESIFSKETSNSDMGRLIGRLPDGLTILQNIPASQSGTSVAEEEQSGMKNPPTLAASHTVQENQVKQPTSVLLKGVPQNNNAFVVVGRLPDGLTILQNYQTVEPAISAVTEVKCDKKIEVSDNLNSEENLALPKEELEDIKFVNVAKETFIHLVTGGYTQITPSNLIAVRPAFPVNMKCNFGDDIRCQMRLRAENLRKKLEQDGFLKDPISWLIRMQLLPEKTLCRFCFMDNTALMHDGSGLDGYSWRCLNPKCMKHGVISRPKFFTNFNLPLSIILPLIFHWAVQSDLNTILNEISVTIPTIRYVWRAIQEVCSKAINFKAKKLGGSGKIVEVSVIQMGRFFIVGAMDRATRYTRIKAISVNVGWKPDVFQKHVESWLIMRSIVVSEMSELHDLESKGYIFCQPNSAVKNRDSDDAHILTISHYLKEQLSHMFGKLMVNRLRVETLQYFLDELQWRERFGIITSMAFWNILSDIGKQSGRVASLDDLSTLTSTRTNYSGVISLSTSIKDQLIEGKGSSKCSVSDAHNNISRTKLNHSTGAADDGDSSRASSEINYSDSVATTNVDKVETTKEYSNSKCSVSFKNKDISEELLHQSTVSSNDISTLASSRRNYSSSGTTCCDYKKESLTDKTNLKHPLVDPEDHIPNKKMKASRNSISLEEYYYARKAAVQMETVQKTPIPYFRCNFCKRLFSNNIRMMSHIIGHVEQNRSRNLDLSDLTRCKHCFRSFDTPFNMQNHIVAVHLHPNPLTCRICALEFTSAESLVAHMENVHVECEMPYSCRICQFSSSFHKEILQHFQKAHNNTEDVLCPYCLKVYGIRFSNQKYCYHIFRHQFKSSVRKCPSCCLGFLNGNELQAHRNVDHRSMAGCEGLIPFVADKNNILMMDPKEKMKSHVEKVESKPPILKSAERGLFYEFLKLTPPENLKGQSQPPEIKKESFPKIHIGVCSRTCLECRKEIQKGHFKKHVRCGTCKYSTYCSTAFVEHMISDHSTVRARRPKANVLQPLKLLRRAMFCSCGFSSFDGSALATHLVQCEEDVAYTKLPKSSVNCTTSPDKNSFIKASASSSSFSDTLSKCKSGAQFCEDMLCTDTEVNILEDIGHFSGDTKCEQNSPVQNCEPYYFLPYISTLFDEEQTSCESFSESVTLPSITSINGINLSGVKKEEVNFQDPLQVESEVRILDEELFTPAENTATAFPIENHSAMFPPLVVLDSDEEASINESFSKVSTFPTLDNSYAMKSTIMAPKDEKDYEAL